jgi:hypothetical protein
MFLLTVSLIGAWKVAARLFVVRAHESASVACYGFLVAAYL